MSLAAACSHTQSGVQPGSSIDAAHEGFCCCGTAVLAIALLNEAGAFTQRTWRCVIKGRH